MFQLGTINHPTPHIDRKVKYFHDWFHYYLLKNSKRIDGFPENHLSYLERMLFRMEALTRMHQSTRMVICAWLSQPEFDTENDLFSKKSSISPLVKRLKQISTQIKGDFDLSLFKETTKQIIEEINGIDGLNGTIYFANILKSQISLLSCPCELDTHKDEIIRNSRWLVAEYIRQGFEEKELGGLNGVFKRLMQFDLLKTDPEPHFVKFPLPPDLNEKRNSSKFEAGIKDLLTNNLFVTQFEGMLNALKETKQGTIYFRVDGIRTNTESNFEFNYAGVRFLSADKISFDDLGCSKLVKKDFARVFLKERGAIIALVPISFKSKSQAIIMARYQACKALDALRYVLAKSGGTISKDRVIIAWSRGGADYHMNGEDLIEIAETDITRLLNSEKTIFYPDNINQETRSYIDQCNRIFFKGLSCENPDDIVSYFWQYWETAFAYYKERKPNKAEFIIKNLSSILSKESWIDLKMYLGLIMHDYANNNSFGNKEIGIPDSYYGHDFDFKKPEKTVEKIRSLTAYPFFKSLIERFEAIEERKEDERHEEFFSEFLWQLYEQRNFISHDGTYCPATLERLKFFFRPIVVKWQAKLFNELERVPNSTVQETIERMILSSKT